MTERTGPRRPLSVEGRSDWPCTLVSSSQNVLDEKRLHAQTDVGNVACLFAAESLRAFYLVNLYQKFRSKIGSEWRGGGVRPFPVHVTKGLCGPLTHGTHSCELLAPGAVILGPLEAGKS